MMSSQFAEKFLLARQSAIESNPKGGLCGFELEWNLLDESLRPLLTVGSGPARQSFVDYLRAEQLSNWARPFSQLEVFHWMIEWATRPYYTPRAAVYEARAMEAILINALHAAGQQFGERLYYWHGNLLFLATVGHDSIPTSWHLAKRRYLERCVDLYGNLLATAGNHTNLSLPDPLLAWDFMHLPASERRGGINGPLHLDEFNSGYYITAARLLRAFTALFIATSAATPLQARQVGEEQSVLLTDCASIRNRTFPNPPAIDLPNLYRSYEDYLHLSYDLVQRGVRFGNNNWTPVRARSAAEPVERLIQVTSEQLSDLYARGLYAAGETQPVEEMAHQIEVQNLMARINLPMSRVEVRTDDGGHPLEVDIANLTLKHLLMLRFYADPDFARSFRYDREDISRARRNEDEAACCGLSAEIENPLTGKPVEMRDFLRWTLAEIRPLAEALDMWEDLHPLIEMAAGAPNTSERLQRRLRQEFGILEEVPLDVLHQLAEEREEQVRQDIEDLCASYNALGPESSKISELLQHGREEARQDPQTPIRFRPRPERVLEIVHPDKTSEILDLAQGLIRIPSVTACPQERLDEVRRAGAFIEDYLRIQGIGVRYYDGHLYPALLAGFPGQMQAPAMLSGHFDVVAPEPDDSQFAPRIEGDYLWGRGSADMKTVVATYLVWMKDTLRLGPPFPPVNLLLVGNEENGETQPMGTPHVLRLLAEEDGYSPELFIAGERTGERGNELWGEICIQNRGVMRFELIARGQRAHSGTGASNHADLADRLIEARAGLASLLGENLKLHNPDGWQSQARFPFIQVGEPGVYNVTPDRGVIGVEVRPIPQDDLAKLHQALQAFAAERNLEIQVSVMENGIACDPENSYLKSLIAAVRQASAQEPIIGRKLPGTSARFAPKGQGVVWGQAGIAPHGNGERHYIPSILPYYQALQAYADNLKEMPAK
jgi:succinyl-diaminopimelate desuccinylase